ncbi:MAG: Gfo/Idh/MocA family protein [Bacteroides sp.]
MIRIGILCPAEIALRRFMPALVKCNSFEYVGVGVSAVDERMGSGISDIDRQGAVERQKRKAEEFVNNYGGRIFENYKKLIESDAIDAVYIPLPPAMHYKWAKLALENGKHVLLEKPFTTSLQNTKELIELAKSKDLALHENYMFTFHSQISDISNYIQSGMIGDVKLYRVSFGFPRREVNDFRYNKELGGGALLDCGGYTVKYASILLGSSIKLLYSNMCNEKDIDIFGSAAFINNQGTVVQTAYGMDNDYKCELEAWGSKGTIKSGRVLTAPVGFEPVMQVVRNNSVENVQLSADDAFANSIEFFKSCISNSKKREQSYKEIMEQAELVEAVMKFAKE